jgi:ribosomal protein S27E
MDHTELMLDGNALAGHLREVFVHEMTSARIACDGCGKIEAIGAEHAYMQAPGIVLRCRHCDDVLLVMTHGGGRYILGLRGSKWLEIVEEA